MSARQVTDQALTATINQIYHRSRGTYGAPRVHAELRLGLKVACGRKRVARLMRTAGLLGSMGQVASSVDNTMIESFWSTMQRELLDRRTWPTREELASAIFEWIESFYNPVRRHSALGYRSPNDFEDLHTAATNAA